MSRHPRANEFLSLPWVHDSAGSNPRQVYHALSHDHTPDHPTPLPSCGETVQTPGSSGQGNKHKRKGTVMTDLTCVCGTIFTTEEIHPNTKITSCPWCPTDAPPAPAEVRYNFCYPGTAPPAKRRAHFNN